MNLFLLGVGVGPGTKHRFAEALGRVARRHFPEIDLRTSWQAEGAGVCAVGAHRPVADRDRTRVRKVGDRVVAVDGLAIDPQGRQLDAEVAAHDWDGVARFQGRFSALRVSTAPGEAELVVDALGMAQVYVLQHEGAQHYSNSVALLQAVAAGGPVLDLVGASHFAALGWVPGDRTLDARVCVLPAGARVRWSTDDGLRSEALPATFEALADPRAPLGRDDVRELGDVLSAMVQAAADSADRLDCPLTAGRDTRLLAALAMHGGVRPTYYTWGRPRHRDVRVAVELATRFGWSHELRARGDEGLETTWDDAVADVIGRGDGLVSLRHATSPRREVADTVVLSGSGGELCRTTYATPRSMLLPLTAKRVTDQLARRLVRNLSGLVCAAAASSAGDHLREYVERATQDGVRPFDVFELFYADSRVRRWAASNFRVDQARTGAPFAPFCTKAFVDACFRATPEQLHGEWIGHTLMTELAPQLLSVDYERTWRRANRPAIVAQQVTFSARRLDQKVRRKVVRASGPRGRVRWRKELRSAWFEPLRETLRRSCLDHASSPLWEVVDRRAFERLTAADVPAGQRLYWIDGLLDAITLFEYRHGAAGPWAGTGTDDRS